MSIPDTLYKKMLAVQKAIQSVGKGGLNKFSNYKYAGLDDILPNLAPLLAEQSLIHTVTCSNASCVLDQGYSVGNCMMVLSVIDTETDEKMEFYGAGFATDKNGDKALYKAITGARKYLYMSAFGLYSTDDEPEHQTQEQGLPPQKQYQPQGASSTYNQIMEALHQANVPRELYHEAIKFHTLQGADEKTLKVALNNVKAYIETNTAK